MGPTTTSLMNPNMTDVHIASGNDIDLLYYRNPMCPQCMSHNIVKNGTFTRLLETSANVNVQRYTCKDCGFLFEARTTNHGYGNQISEDTKKKSIACRSRHLWGKHPRRCNLQDITMNSTCTLTALIGTGHCWRILYHHSLQVFPFLCIHLP